MTAAETIVHTNEPGKVLPVLESELEDFQTEALRFLKGEWPSEAAWIGFRLKQGVYGQRQPNVQMIRCKLPFGGITPAQLDAFAEVAERFVPLRKGHITTRQNVQFHHVPLGLVPELLRTIGRAGVSSREACGNTVRNVTGDPLSGVSSDDVFDITPYAGAFARFWLRNPLSQLLPRKFKVSFSSSPADRAVSAIHDLGFIAKTRDGRKGFEMRAGGGTSTMARRAVILREFVPVEEYLRISEAVIRIFNRADELRKNRAKARLKFLVDRVGPDEFRRMVDAEIAANVDGWASKEFRPDRLLYLDDEELTAPSRGDFARPAGDGREFQAFVAANVSPQRQAGFSTVEVRVPRGDLGPAQLRGLAEIARTYAGGRARTTIQQNLVLRWVRDESLYEVWRKLTALDLGTPGASSIADIVSCPGTDSCKLGITSSMGLNRAIEERIELLQLEDPLTRKIHVKISGCPNGCGQHHVANIGFHGAAMKVGENQLPAYHVFVGGQYENDGCRFGQQLKVRLPSKRGPEAVERLIRVYERERQPGEEFNAFVDRAGLKPFEEAIADLCIPGELTEDNTSMFIDWARIELYKLQRGEGECAV